MKQASDNVCMSQNCSKYISSLVKVIVTVLLVNFAKVSQCTISCRANHQIFWNWNHFKTGIHKCGQLMAGRMAIS